MHAHLSGVISTVTTIHQHIFNSALPWLKASSRGGQSAHQGNLTDIALLIAPCVVNRIESKIRTEVNRGWCTCVGKGQYEELEKEVATTMRTFFDLPRELRDLIYDYVLFDPTELSESSHHFYTWIDMRRFRNGRPECLTYRAPPLLATCRLIRWEASPTYYHKIQFRFTEAETAIRWLSKLDDESRHDVRSLAYCPNLLTWMDPRHPPLSTASLGHQWHQLCEFLRFAAIDMRETLKIGGYGGGKLGWILVEGLDFMYAAADQRLTAGQSA